MKHREEEHVREILHEAFLAGWQAALGVYIRNPRALAIIDSCFEQWLGEAADEAEVLGLTFRGRYDLPGSLLENVPPQPSSPQPTPLQASPPQAPVQASPPRTSPLPVELTYGRTPTPPAPEQDDSRTSAHATARDTPQREPA